MRSQLPITVSNRFVPQHDPKRNWIPNNASIGGNFRQGRADAFNNLHVPTELRSVVHIIRTWAIFETACWPVYVNVPRRQTGAKRVLQILPTWVTSAVWLFISVIDFPADESGLCALEEP